MRSSTPIPPPGSRSTPSSTGLAFLFGCFFLSGVTGLVYEVIWLRVLGLVFGHSVHAITAVLAAFMGGLALGSFLLGRSASRIRNLVGAYGWLEIGIGLYCAVLPLLLAGASTIYLGLHRWLDLSPLAFTSVQFLLVFLVLLVPTTLMGGTLPVLTQTLSRGDVNPGRTVGRLYAVNTLGAVIGVVAAGYFLLPALGNTATTLVAAAANLMVGVLAVAYGLARPGRATAVVEAHGPEPAAGWSDRLSWKPGLGLGMAAAALSVSGATSMLYEVAWSRALALVIGSSTYAFTAMLVAFLAGIAGGSALYSWVWGRRSASLLTLAVIQAVLGAGVLVVQLAFERMPELFLAAVRWSDSPAFIQLTQIVISAGTLLLVTLPVGATFPCAVTLAARGTEQAGRDVGHLYAANTVGAIAGTVLAGFVILPVLGVQGSITLGIGVNLVLAAVLFVASPAGGGFRWAGATVAVILAAAVGFVPRWNQNVMSSGPAIYAKSYLRQGGSLAQQAGEDLLFYRDGLSSTVSVHRDGEHVLLRVNGKTDAGTKRDMPTQLLSGHLPLMAHPRPRTVLVIGLGSGITVAAVARHPVESIDVVEIEPAVIEASRFFAPWHGNVLDDRRVRTVVADGRNFLLTTPVQYDVIVSEPSNPWMGGLASLFSREFFELARQRLRADGIMVQWLQGYGLFPDDFRMVVRTFTAVFPATTIWNTVGGDYLLVGRAEPAPLDLGLLRERFEGDGVREHLHRIGLPDWRALLGHFVLAEEDVVRFAETASLNTDDRLPLEFSAPRALYSDTGPSNREALRRARTAALPRLHPGSQNEVERPEIWLSLGKGALRRHQVRDALAYFQRARALDPTHAQATLWAAAASLKLGEARDALALATAVLGREPRKVEALVLAGYASAALDGWPAAVSYLERASRAAPGNAQIERALFRARSGVRGGPWTDEDGASLLTSSER